MAYILLQEFEGPDASEDNSGVKTTSRVFRVQYEDGTRAIVALNEADIPSRGTTHPDDINLKLITKAVTAISDDKRIFEVTCQYSTVTTASEFTENPLKRDPEVTWGFFETSEVVVSDNEGNAIQASSTEPYQTALMENVENLELTIVRNEKTFDPDRALEFQGTVNEKKVTIAGKISQPRQALLVQYTGSKQKENEIDYWSVTYRIRFKEDTWDKQILDQGFNELIAGTVTPILDTTQQKIQEPVKLDGNGRVLAQGETPVFNSFRIKYETDFKLLGLFTSGQ